MYENVCYEKPFLKSVIVRVDFLGTIEILEKTIAPRLVNAISVRFPIAEPADAIAAEFQIGAAGNLQEKAKVSKQWNFFDKEREKQLTIAAGCAFINYAKYFTYEDMVADFKDVVGSLRNSYPEAKVGRFGLRYVNQIELNEIAEPTKWDGYVSDELLSLHAFFGGSTNLTRLFHLAELRYDDISVKFQFGMPNPDYPAIIKRPIYVLDIDAYVQIAHELDTTLSYLDRAHDYVQDLFERSITDRLREQMHARREDGH
jgi:uncharacterized protein (TIGR04255 family)